MPRLRRVCQGSTVRRRGAAAPPARAGAADTHDALEQGRAESGSVASRAPCTKGLAGGPDPAEPGRLLLEALGVRDQGSDGSGEPGEFEEANAQLAASRARARALGATRAGTVLRSLASALRKAC